MTVPKRYVFKQGPVIAAIGRTVLSAAKARAFGKGATEPPVIPGPEYKCTLPPRNRELLRDYILNMGGDPEAYRGTVPGHFFPQWTFPLAGKLLKGLPYPMTRALNAGCRIEQRHPLPDNEELQISARLENIDDNGSRAIFFQRFVTGTAAAPEALICDMQALVPLGGEKKKKDKDEKPTVPAGAREIAYYQLSHRAGLDFALLTGDFNPIHWLTPFARAAGFKNVILHGFATLGRSIERLIHVMWDGDPGRFASIEVRFTRPLVLPAKVGFYVDDQDGIFVGDGPGELAYMTGTFAGRAGVKEEKKDG